MWLSKRQYKELADSITAISRRLSSIESDMNGTNIVISPYFYGCTFPAQTGVLGRLKDLETLRQDFDLLTEHLGVSKQTSPEVTRFAPCKKAK